MDETDSAGFRTSPQQRAAWRHPNARAQLTARLDGPPDADRLSAAVAQIRRRHEILRTRLVALPGHTSPVQVIDEECHGLDDIVAGSGLEAVRAKEWRHGEGVRIVLVSPEPARSALILTAPATLVDLPSLRQIFKEITDVYAGRELASADIQHADFAAWHNALLDEAAREARRRFWDQHVDSALTMPAAEIVSEVESAEWRTVERRLDAWPAGHDAVAAAWAIMLWRLCGERNLLVTTTVSGRDRPELENAVGPYEREIPIVCRFAATDSFHMAVSTMRRALDAAIANVDDLDPARLPHGMTPGFEAIDEADAAGVLHHDRRTPAPCLLRSVSTADGHVLRLAYDPARLADMAARQLLDRLVVTLGGLVEAPDAPIESVSMLLPGEAESLLRQGEGAPARSADGKDLPELIAEQARRTPEAIAVQDGRWQLTYARLDSLANGYAARLTELGVLPGTRVALRLPRSCAFVVAALAVMKAGAAYIPVDIRHPARRVAVIADDAQPVLLITTEETRSVEGVDVPVFAIDMEDPVVGGDVAPSNGDADRLAYLMYTSGSTGRPNGVPVTHRSLLNYLLWAADAYRLSEGGGAIAHTSVGFDLTVTTMWAPLMVGQRVRLVEEGAGLGVLVDVMRSELDITLVKATPSQLEALLDVIGPQELARRVRTLVLGGEALRTETIAALRGVSHLRIVNEYGPTETVVGSCAHVLGESDADTGAVPIGRPVAGTHIYVLNGLGQPVPDGVPGEIYIGGAGVASGYVGRPELTAARFVSDPVLAGAIAYRTGDRARRVGGELVYEGRLDEQLKVLGVRVEPGEIEAVLCEHPAVAHAAAIGWRPDGADSAIGIAALIVATEGHPAPKPGELAPFCRERLADYLVPMVFATAEALPLTDNGKLDRSAVAAAIAEHAKAQTPFAAPRTETEEILAGAIGAVLGRDRVGIDDNYFAIGGDSIRSVMVASRAQARGVALSVADIHQRPTVRQLAQAVSSDTTAFAEPQTEPFSLISAQDRALMPPEVEDAFPLNLLQEGMIFHRDFAAKSAVYHAIASVRLRAPFDIDAMRHVIHELVRRHPMLRTSFDQTTFSRPLQLVHSTFHDPLGFEDLRGRGEAEQQERIEAFVLSEKSRGFELDEYPLIRFRVHRLDDETFQFTYGFHHEIVDGWSEALMVTELFGHYLSIVFGEPEVPSAPRSTMRDAVALELEALQRNENYEFWADYLADATLMRLPRKDSGPKADKGAREIVRIAVPVSPQLSDGLKRLALSRTVPLKSVLLAAHMAVMNRYHGQNDTLTYTVTNGRPENADGSTAIGLFVNSLALRVRMDGGTWGQLILQTLDSERKSLPYRRLPMAELKRHQGNEPLAETLFFFTDYHVFRELDRWRERGVEHMASELYGESTFPFCAIFRLNRDTGQLEVRIEYDSLQFSADLMDRIGATYERVLAAIVADPEQSYHPLELLSEAETLEIEQLGQGEPAHWDVATIHEVFARQAATTPDAVALVWAQGTLTYAALASWAGTIAANLQTAGAGPETTVGLLAERSPEAVAAILGILQSGAAYLPLDPGQPDDRLDSIVADARPVVVLAQPEHAHRTSAPIEVLDAAPPAKAMKAKPVKLVADNLAYVIYTSGSTGTPKGVGVTHRSLVSSTLARTVAYPEPPHRYMLLSPLVFDSSVAGLFWSLCTGAALYLPREGAQFEPGELLDIAQRQQITHTLCVPSLVSALLEREQPQNLRSLSTLIVAGEASPTELLATVQRDLPGCTVYNEYGPTENCVWSTVWTGDPPADRTQLPIGRPIPGTGAYVLSSHLNRVPIGVAAELHLAGAGVARGYLGDPRRTAEKFVPDPFAAAAGQRMYRSGDLARHDSFGELEFLGRMDNQVKIRGFRVELGEIEGTLDTHADVHRCVVVARDLGADEKGLVAYVVPRAGASVNGQALQQYLRERVPKYMVPSAVCVLDELPLTRTGKIDHSALPDTKIETDMAPPETETEQVVAAIWCQALGRELIGVHDAFFDLGGESLRAMQVVTKANKVFGLNLSVRALFDTPTVAEFAQLVDDARTASTMDPPG
ncbi:hypothetical protein Rhe02_14950 [Rhizocola hellebori]|uniref:Carrier domain-containing protein n=1 Tax=Rhizocola hellebori TaxID=1392758 RepID=A0A8J3Q505_9ACTN|nr:non-ribosomal peptide synthetase [Rhizocola hellebori]GIH03428.1 hypothetical protein Rhe02_14950 [Rhizocola hellebori]